ncbi:MAG: DUF5615 family PIN-like protein [Caldilineaceae bacterium]
MSLPIYLDDCAFSHRLRQLLVKAGHRVQIPAEVTPSLRGAADDIHLAHARTTQQSILTYNAADFLRLHKQQPDHYGILTVYQDNDPTKDMTYADIVRAIANLEQTGVDIAGGFWSLNAYRW